MPSQGSTIRTMYLGILTTRIDHLTMERKILITITIVLIIPGRITPLTMKDEDMAVENGHPILPGDTTTNHQRHHRHRICPWRMLTTTISTSTSTLTTSTDPDVMVRRRHHHHPIIRNTIDIVLWIDTGPCRSCQTTIATKWTTAISTTSRGTHTTIHREWSDQVPFPWIKTWRDQVIIHTNDPTQHCCNNNNNNKLAIAP